MAVVQSGKEGRGSDAKAGQLGIGGDAGRRGAEPVVAEIEKIHLRKQANYSFLVKKTEKNRKEAMDPSTVYFD